MIVHEVFAQVSENEVKNIIVCESYPIADYLTKCIYGEKAFAVDCSQYPCAIGDQYYDGYFWRYDSETKENVCLKYIPTQEQQIELLKAENNEITIALADLIGGAS